MPGVPLVKTSPPTRQGSDDHGFVLGWDIADGDEVLVALVGGNEGDARPYDTQEGVAVTVRPGEGRMSVEAHQGERDENGDLWAEGWQPVTFPLTDSGETDQVASIVVNTAQACALRISCSPGGAGTAAVRFGTEPQRGYQG